MIRNASSLRESNEQSSVHLSITDEEGVSSHGVPKTVSVKVSPEVCGIGNISH